MIEYRITESDILHELEFYKKCGIREGQKVYKAIAVKYSVTTLDVIKMIATMKGGGRLTEVYLRVEEPPVKNIEKVDKPIKIVKLCRACLDVLEDGRCFRCGV